jgi:S-layer homology domain
MSKKTFRKAAISTMAASTVVAAVAPAATFAASSTFTDVTPSTDHYEAITALAAAGVINGYQDGSFKPYKDLNRAQAAVLLYEALDLNAPANLDSALKGLNDVSAKHEYAKQIAAVTEAGIFNGKPSSGKFNAYNNITREQMATVLVKAFGLDKLDLPKVNINLDNVDPSHKANVQILANAGITNQVNNFNPTGKVTRGSFATFLKLSMDAVSAPEVVSVSAIDATRVEIKFAQPVDKASLFTDGESGAFKQTAGVDAVTLKSIDAVTDGTLTGELSADGKTLTVTSTLPLEKRYDVVVQNLTTTNGAAVAKYVKVHTFAADKTAPVITSVTKLSASTFKVTFSEPMNNLGNLSFKLADGTPLTLGTTGTNVIHNFTTGAKEVTFTLSTGVDANKEVIGTFIGAQDQALNLMNPNPATVTFVKGAPDGVAPTVTSINQLEANKFVVAFSEQLQDNPVITINDANANTVTSIDKDSTDPTKYVVTTSLPLDGTTTVSVSSFTDLSGVNGTAYSKVVAFTKDTVAPKVTSSSLVIDESTRAEYLEVTFNKDVVLTTATVDVADGSYVLDYVTTDIAVPVTGTSVSLKSNTKNVVRIPVATILGSDDQKGATYTLDLAFSGVASASGVAVEDTTVTFKRGEDGTPANATVAAVTSVVQDAANNSKVNVTFNTAVDGASATNTNNYRVDGAVVESVTLLPASGGTQVAVLNLKADSNNFSGNRYVSISNVKALGSSKVMTPFYEAVNLDENVAPKVTSAKLTATNQITLTFSEAVTDTTGADFEVLIGGKSQATPEPVDAAVGATPTNTVVVTIGTIDATELAQGISLKALSTLDIVDGKGNKLSVPANITVTN